ncbi:acyl-CoA dehydrogenase [Halieaceae bacterium IMCC8485]|uniref:Acyl-CoA dehydrogenase n=1 Tax=Candidatus Seongchinamella marina TaxID=2518990 RepID=A0ABT3SVM1_9GAMM|nr:acyl-CoA dehydrogenase family protein [Candidatus Seongchinamella marina]MCX2973666.1 acyl-CoA dehydrogenase [Candidatus Seongchinamella marina]
MQFTEQHNEIRRTVSQFVKKEINPFVEEWEEAGIFPAHEVFKKAGNLGLLGIHKPEEYGGLGLDYSYALVAQEEWGSASHGSVPLSIAVQTDMATPALARFGSDELKRDFLTPAIAGDMVTSIGVSEPHAGSDVAAIKTTAIKRGDDYVINGTKMWITNSTQADYICLLANTSDDQKHVNKSLIIVPTDVPGFSTSSRLNKLGMRASDTAQLFFDDVVVPQRYLIGEEGKGFTYQMMQFQEERIAGSAITIKGLENCINETIEYTSQRQAFGKPLLNNQIINMKLAEMQMEIESLRALTYCACETYINGGDPTLLASYAKLKAGKLCNSIPTECLQFWGGMGYMWDNPVGRAMRDMRLTSIGGGADEVMLGIIGKMMGLGKQP